MVILGDGAAWIWNLAGQHAAARTFPLAGRKVSDLPTALGYFEHNAHRMQGRLQKLGMFVGSGAVEVGRETIVGQRCILSGMRWTLAGGCAGWGLDFQSIRRRSSAWARWTRLRAVWSETPRWRPIWRNDRSGWSSRP
jgi:hypothetical protein